MILNRKKGLGRHKKLYLKNLQKHNNLGTLKCIKYLFNFDLSYQQLYCT